MDALGQKQYRSPIQAGQLIAGGNLQITFAGYSFTAPVIAET